MPDTLLLRSPELCAMCESGESHYDIIHLKFEKYGRLRLCGDCFEGLIHDNRSQQCGMCNRKAEYGTWRTERYDATASVDAKDIQYVPDHWLLCEGHFRQLEKETNLRLRQTRVHDFDEGGYRGYLSTRDWLLPMRRELK